MEAVFFLFWFQRNTQVHVQIMFVIFRFFQSLGDICDWSSSDLQRMGSVASALNENQIECLENLDDDAAASLGHLTSWNQQQVVQSHPHAEQQ